MQEKKLQYRSYPDLYLNFENGVKNYQLFTSMGSTQFKRVICNLISNAAEAMSYSSVVTINAAEIENEIQIEISDTGPGFDEQFKDQLFENGFTTKSNGNGLGLYNAKKEVEGLGGRITVSNNNGAIVRLTLPKASPPSNFPAEINLNGIIKIIVLDDDESIHRLWDKRLSKYKIELEHFYTAQALLEKYAQLPQNYLLLSDYELLGEELSGIDCITRLNAAKNSFLVTARADEYEINSRCSELNLKLLPKNMALIIPVTQGLDKKVVLIDDDELVHMSWKRAGKKSGIEVSTYYTMQSFIDNFYQYDKATTIYIDSNLSEDIKGEIESERIKDLGFDDLFLATGYLKDDIAKPLWIKDIVGKSPAALFSEK
jgi:CheY-like chemotaxis protein